MYSNIIHVSLDQQTYEDTTNKYVDLSHGFSVFFVSETLTGCVSCVSVKSRGGEKEIRS